jgi:hypothetical protein
MARVAAFADIAEEFRRRSERTIWATMATAGPRGRLQSRIVHPLWEGSTGWLLTDPGSVKGRHLRRNPHTSLTYWDQTNEQVHAECRAEWEGRPAEKRRVWDLFKNTPVPLGYDPGLFFTEGPDAASCGVVRLVPWRIELWSLADLLAGAPARVWRA